MSAVTFAKKDSAAPAAARRLRIGEPDDAFEREADRVADEMLAGGKLTRHWSISRMGVAAPLQRKCGCGGSGGASDECDDCKAKKLLQRKPSAHGAPNVAPPIVHSVLSSMGRPLDRATRAFFEPRLGVDLGSVQVHDDSRAAQSAAAVHAHAYTAGDSIVFGAGRYRPDSLDGRRLLAHELTHVVHQRGATDRLVQREDGPELVEQAKTGSLIERAFDAADAARWQEAAELANGLSASDLKAFMAALGGGWKVEQLHIGAINNPRVGPNSQIAKATHSAYLNAKFTEQMKGGFYQAASEYLNGFSDAEIRARVGKMTTGVVAGLHIGAVAQAGLGPDSKAARITAEELNKRKEKGDAAADAATKPVTQESAPEKKKRCQATGGQGFKIFPLRLPKGMWQLSNAPIGAERKGDEILVKQPFNEVKGDPMFRRETKTLPLDTFLGGIRLQKDEIVGVRLYDDKERLVCVSGEDMLKFNDATEMALWFSVGRTALDAATVFAPGASAGVGKVTAFGVGNIAAGQALEIGRQEMEVHYGLRDQVDWAGIAFDTAFQLATLGFSQYLNNAATKAVLGKAPELGQRPAQLAIQAAVQGGTGLVHAAARTAFDLLRKEKQKFVMEEFLQQLALEFATGALFAFVAGAAHHEEGVPGQKRAAPGDHEPGAPPPAGHEETPTPHATPQKEVSPPPDEHLPTTQSRKKATAHEDEQTGSASQKKADEAKAPSVEEGTAVRKEDAVAQERTKDGHDIVVTGKGVGKCSPPPCPVIHIEYAEELRDRPRLQEAYAEIERLRVTGTKADARKAARHSKQLVDVLEGIRAENKLTPGRKNLPTTGEPDEFAEPVMDTSELLQQPEVQEGKPVDIRVKEAQAGNKFDEVAGKKYGANEVPIKDKGGRLRRLDSYDAVKGEIVSRKSLVTANGQIAFIDDFTMIGYFQEFALKYPDGATIASTSSTRNMSVNGKPLAGQKLKGQYVLEVPPQEYPIPPRIKEEAAKRGIIIRDDKGKVY